MKNKDIPKKKCLHPIINEIFSIIQLTYFMNIQLSNPLICSQDLYMTGFLVHALKCFKDELYLYIDKNDDADVLYYCNEKSLASMFINGLIRNDKDGIYTSLQEYTTDDINTGSGIFPDIFLNHNKTPFWIECKMDRTFLVNDANHWDIKGWLEWDYKTAFKQAENYFNSENSHLNSCYSENKYVMTMIFKTLKENAHAFSQKSNSNLCGPYKEKFSRDWYYSNLFILKSENEDISIGLEIYGTFQKMK